MFEAQATAMGVDVMKLAKRMRAELEIQDRSHRLQTFKSCFVGSHAVRWMIRNGLVSNVKEAETVGDYLIDHGIFCHVNRTHMFENSSLFYRFAEDWPAARTSPRLIITNAATSVARKLRKAM